MEDECSTTLMVGGEVNILPHQQIVHSILDSTTGHFETTVKKESTKTAMNTRAVHEIREETYATENREQVEIIPSPS